MSRNRNKKPLLLAVEVTDFAAEGKAIGRYEEKIVFINGAVPGDVVDVQVTKKRTSFYEGRPVVFRTLSPIRIAPFCGHFGTCGGCKWQNIPYEKQLEFKSREVYENLRRIGKVALPEPLPIIGSAENEFYRNKLEYTFSNRRWLTDEEVKSGVEATAGVGFHIPGLFDKVVDIEECHLQREPSNKIRNFLRDLAYNNNIDFYDLKSQRGFLRTLIIRTASTGEVMVIVTFGRRDEAMQEFVLKSLAEAFTEITSLMYVVNEKCNDTINDLEVECFRGKDHIFEQMEDLRFKVGPKSFYQTNSAQAYELYKVARNFAGLTGVETVYDLYTGTGTIANFVARRCKRVIGIEYVPEAIEDARVNSSVNGIENTIFYAGDMKDVLTVDFIAEHGYPDVMIVDPPRAGMHGDVVATILKVKPKKIVYVSCNSATQARDINLLSGDYYVSRMRAVDMFPHTHHVESVVELMLK